MHYCCEVCVPPTANTEDAVAAVMAEFAENREDARHGFWDWYQIGGRWSGRKLLAGLDTAQIDAFRKWLVAEKITVSGVVFGKQELSPHSQREKVDAKWREMFQGSTAACPFFRHAGDALPLDVMRLADVPPSLTAERVIFGAIQYDGKLGPEFMLARSVWNGCNHMEVQWDGTFASALALHRDQLAKYHDEYAAKITPTDDWLVVTVDYHS